MEAVSSAAPGNVQSAVSPGFLGQLGGVLVNGFGLFVDQKFNRLAGEPDIADSLNADENEAAALENAKSVDENLIPGVTNQMLIVGVLGIAGLVFLIKSVR